MALHTFVHTPKGVSGYSTNHFVLHCLELSFVFTIISSLVYGGWAAEKEAGGEFDHFFSIKVLPRIGPSKSLDPSTYPTGDSKSWMSLQTPRQVSRPLYLFCQSLDVGCLQGGGGVLSEGPGMIHTGSLDLEPVIPRAEEIVLATQGADWLAYH